MENNTDHCSSLELTVPSHGSQGRNAGHNSPIPRDSDSESRSPSGILLACLIHPAVQGMVLINERHGASQHPELLPLSRYNKLKRKLRFHASQHDDVDFSFTPQEYAPLYSVETDLGWQRTIKQRSEQLWQIEQERSQSISSGSKVEPLRPSARSLPPFPGLDSVSLDDTIPFAVSIGAGRPFGCPLRRCFGS